MSFEPIISGAALGILLAFLVGPVFFLIIDVGIKHGLRAAVPLVAGVAISDACFMLLTVAGTGVLHWFQEHHQLVGRLGGVLLISFGLSFFLRKPHVRSAEIQGTPQRPNPWREFMKGFFLNVLNPFVPLFWIGVAASLAGKAYAPAATFQFYSTTLLVVFSTDLLKAAFARKLEPLMTPSRFRVLHRISGLGLVLFGLRLLFSA